MENYFIRLNNEKESNFIFSYKLFIMIDVFNLKEKRNIRILLLKFLGRAPMDISDSLLIKSPFMF